MNKRDMAAYRKKVWNKYKIPNMSNLHRLKQNSVTIHTANGYPHESKKFDICYEIQSAGMKFITEAQSCKDGRIVDIVVLDTGTEIEVVDSSLTDKTKKAMEKKDVPILVYKISDRFSVDDLIKRKF